MQAPAPGTDVQPPESSPLDAWLGHLRQVSYIRGHISVFALGSVLLLVIDLLSGDGGVWADTLIGAWSVLVIAHGIVAVIARLLMELLADEDGDTRPAAEMRGSTLDTWTLPPRTGDRQPTPGPPPQPAQPEPAAPQPETQTERVSWKAATDAAWLTRRDEDTEREKPDEPDDFTPLKLD